MGNLLFIYSTADPQHPHTHNLCPTHRLAALTFSPALFAAFSPSVSVGMFDWKSVTMHLYRQRGWEIIKFNNSLDSALFDALLVYSCTLFPWCLTLSLSHFLLLLPTWQVPSELMHLIQFVSKSAMNNSEGLCDPMRTTWHAHLRDNNLLGYKPIFWI